MKKMISAAMIAAGLWAGTAAASQQGRDVTTAPVLVRDVKPAYPRAAMAEKQQGRIQLMITVKSDGTVGKVRVTQPLSAQLDAAAVKAAKQWRFKPGTRNGKAVPVETAAEMTFTLR